MTLPRILIGAGLVVSLAACASSPAVQKLESTSRTLGPFVYYEEGSQVLITVGTNATRQRPEEPYFPIEIGIANKQHRDVIRVTREMFTMQVADGEEIHVATAPEIISGYKPVNADRLLFNSRQWTGMYFDRYRPVPSRFYPNSQRRSGLVQEMVELGSGTFFQDILYFKNPGFSLSG
ncbi:MAG: hypothetical protein O7F16_01605, partial [Acidobacteria bacterium]|nr:hypothetical protein [Acidobacteriota bacterium]